MKMTPLKCLLLGSTLLAGGGAYAQDVTLTIESWRNDDLPIWQEKIIPAFEAAHPGIKLNFAPSAPAEYNAVLNSKLDAGSAGDLITCRPFDPGLGLYDKGQLADLTDLAAMANFGDVAKSGWSTDDGAHTFCVPMASVLHGFIYNKTAFEELGIEVAEDRGRVLRRPRQDQGGRHLHPDGDGHQRPVGSRDHGLPEHRPELLEGRGRPAGADQGRAEADRPAVGRALHRRSPSGRTTSATASRRRPIPTARTSSPSAAPPSTRPAPGRSRRSARRSPTPSRWAPSRRRSRTTATPATSPTTSTSRSA